jgi:hypothetical protein
MASTTLNTHLRDNLLHLCSTTGNLTLTSTGPHSLGTTPTPAIMFIVGGTYDATATAATSKSVQFIPALSVAANQAGYLHYLLGTLTEAGSGTHGIFANLVVDAPGVVNAAAALTTAATVYITGVPTGGTNNYALLIETGADDGKHIAISNSDVAHGITDFAATSIYGILRKADDAAGGFRLEGLSETNIGVQVDARVTTVVTTETTGSVGAAVINATLKSGTGVTSVAADDNVAVFRNNGATTHIFKGNGDSYEDGTGWTAYDHEDDLALLEALDVSLDRDLRALRVDTAEWLATHEAALERLGIVRYNRDTDGRPFINTSRHAMLLNGGLRTVCRLVQELSARLRALEAA